MYLFIYHTYIHACMHSQTRACVSFLLFCFASRLDNLTLEVLSNVCCFFHSLAFFFSSSFFSSFYLSCFLIVLLRHRHLSLFLFFLFYVFKWICWHVETAKEASLSRRPSRDASDKYAHFFLLLFCSSCYHHRLVWRGAISD